MSRVPGLRRGAAGTTCPPWRACSATWRSRRRSSGRSPPSMFSCKRHAMAPISNSWPSRTGHRYRTGVAIPLAARRVPGWGGATAPPVSRSPCRGSSGVSCGALGSLLGAAFNPVDAAGLLPYRGERQTKLLLHCPGEEAADGVRLPSRCGHDLGDGYTLRPAQQPDDLGLLRLAWRGGFCRVRDLGCFNPAARSASRLILLLLGGFASGAARLLPRSAGVRRACLG